MLSIIILVSACLPYISFIPTSPRKRALEYSTALASIHFFERMQDLSYGYRVSCIFQLVRWR